MLGKTMAIYHQNLKHISRGKGQSACAAAAYRSATQIYDERLGQTHNYEKKQGVDYTEILAPSYAPSWSRDRAQLWNQVEAKDTRINARPASELDIALPIELSRDQQIQLIRNFAQTTLVPRGLIVDLACHDLHSPNPHAHLLFTTRRINEQGLGEKDRELQKKSFLNHLRQTWADQANAALAQAQRPERIDHRSLAEQGIRNRLPQIHLGPNVCQMRARGIPTARADEYERIAATNVRLAQLDQEKQKLDRQLQQAIEERSPSLSQETPNPPEAEPPSPQQLWQHYSNGIPAAAAVRFRKQVARRALQDGVSEEIVREILTHDPQLQKVKQQQGKEKVNQHLQQIIRSVQNQASAQPSRRSQQQQKQQKDDLTL